MKMLSLEKNSTLHKTHKQANPVRLLTTSCNTAIENPSRFKKNICASLTENMHTGSGTLLIYSISLTQ